MADTSIKIELQQTLGELITLLKIEGLVNGADLSAGYHTMKEFYDRLRALMRLCNSLCPEISFVALKDNPEEYKEEYNGDFVVGLLTPLGPAPLYCKLHHWTQFRFLTPDTFAPLISDNRIISTQERCRRFESLTKMLTQSSLDKVAQTIRESKALHESQKPDAIHKGIEQQPEVVYPGENSDDVTAVTSAINTITNVCRKKSLINYKEIPFGWNTPQDLLDLTLELFCLFTILCPELSFVSETHYDGSMHDGDIIGGFYTPMGPVAFHFKKEYKYRFDHLKMIDRSPLYDGYNHEVAICRIDCLTRFFITGHSPSEVIDFIRADSTFDESQKAPQLRLR